MLTAAAIVSSSDGHCDAEIDDSCGGEDELLVQNLAHAAPWHVRNSNETRMERFMMKRLQHDAI